MDVLGEYKAAGKIGFIGFSTHGHASVIKAAIASKKFDSVNMHCQVYSLVIKLDLVLGRHMGYTSAGRCQYVSDKEAEW